MTGDSTPMRPDLPLAGRRKRASRRWALASAICLLPYVAAVASLGESGWDFVWILAIPTVVGVACAMRALTLGSSMAWAALVLHLAAGVFIIASFLVVPALCVLIAMAERRSGPARTEEPATADEPGPGTYGPSTDRKKRRIASRWVRASEICLFGYFVGYGFGRDAGPVAVWIFAIAAGIGVGTAIRGIRIKASDAWGCLVLHSLAIAILVLAGLFTCSWPMFVYHWRRFFGL